MILESMALGAGQHVAQARKCRVNEQMFRRLTRGDDLTSSSMVELVLAQGDRMPLRNLETSRRYTILLVALVVGGCSAASFPLFDGGLPIGTWGGNGAGMIVGDTAMHLHIGCTYGDVSGRVPLMNGSFDVPGSYMLHAYPIAVGPTVPARFVGRVSGKQATITVTVQDTVAHQTVVKGPVVVTYGQQPQLGPCPICRR